jgi:ACS family hexuronate transporter-like MFS transporter
MVAAEPRNRRWGFRWVICGLLFLATTINYMDRQVLGILAVPLQQEIGWSESEYGLIVTAFQAAYAVGLLAFGRILERVGARAGYALAIAWWSVAAMAHALARSAFGFGVARFALGFGEAGNFPAAVRTVTEWFPARERAFAIGLFNCGSNVGAIITPLAVPWIAIHLGWRWAFALTGAVGLLWLVAWIAVYREPEHHSRVSKDELAHIRSDPGEREKDVSWTQLLRLRPIWALLMARFLTDPVWWFYLYWVPKFLHTKYGLTLDQIGLPLVAIYLAADAGSVFGGWFSSALLKRGWTVNAARKTAILACALMVTPMAFGAAASGTWTAVCIIGLAAAGHQGWAANMFASISDMFPRRSVGSVVGITGFAGSVGGMLVASATGFILEATGSYMPVFIYAGVSYLAVLGLIHWMVPDIRRIGINESAR